MINGGTLALDSPVLSSKISTNLAGDEAATAAFTLANFASPLADRSSDQMAFKSSSCLS